MPKPRQVVVGDVDNDGQDDFVVTYQGEKGVADDNESFAVFIQLPCQ